MSISEKRMEEIRQFKNTDFSDCPVLSPKQMDQMKPCHLFTQKKDITLKIDVDVIESLQNSGQDWQSKVNSLLREAVISGAF